MGQEIIDIGAAPNDGTGDPIRTAFGYTNDNFAQLFSYPNPSPPATLTGKPGDIPGMYAYSSQYFYYCFGTYDGTSLIWSQLPSSAANVSGSYIANGVTQVYTYSNGNVTVSVGGAGNVAIFTPTGVVVRGGISAVGNISTAGNITGNYLYGNGAYITGITAVGATYGNANVASYLPTYYGNIGSIQTNTLYTTGQVSAAGDIITSGLFIGTFQGNITGNLVVPGANTQVIYNNNGASNASAGFTFNQNGNIVSITGSVWTPTVTANRINANSISAVGTIQASAVVATGSGSFSNGIYAGNAIISNGYISAIGDIYGNNIYGNIHANATNATYAINASNIINSNQPNITSVGNTLTVGSIFLNGITNNINTGTINTITVNTNTVNAAIIIGSLTTNAQPNITSIGTLSSLSVTGNVTSGNLSTTNFYANALSVAGNVISSGNIIVSNALSVGSNITTPNSLLVGGNISSAGNIAGSNGNIVNNLSVGNNISVSGNILSTGNISSQGTITSQGMISASGNIYTSDYFIGNFQGNISGNFTIPGSNTQIIYNANGLAGASSGLTFTSGPNALSIIGTVNAQGNITGGNLITTGIANVTSLNSKTICTTGVISTSSDISATGTITATNIQATSCLTTCNFNASTITATTIKAPCGSANGQILMNYNTNIRGATGINYNPATGLLSLAGNTVVNYGITTNTITASTIVGSLVTGIQTNISIVGNTLSVGPSGAGTINAGLVNASKIKGTLSCAAQTNITSVGTLVGLCVTGQLSANSLVSSCGYSIGNINSANVIGAVPLAATLYNGSWAISASGATISFYYGGTKVVTIDSGGNITAARTVTGYGTP